MQDPTKQILFVCEHGAAKSVIAAAYFNRLAAAQGISLHAIARGTSPESEIAPNAARGLKADGLEPAETTPQPVSPDELDGATRIITFGKLGLPRASTIPIEQWDDVPAVSENYARAREVIVAHIRELLGKEAILWA